jgi:hypothetical protein
MLDLGGLEWRPFPIVGTEISPRTGSRAFVFGKILWIFGGVADGTFYDDLFAVDLNSRECKRIETGGSRPSARTSPVFLGYQGRLFLWGGYDGKWPNELYELDLKSFEWKVYAQTVAGRTGTTYTSVSHYGVCYAHRAMGGLIIIDFETKQVVQLLTQGTEPDEHVVNAGMVAVGRRLFLIGGKGTSEYSLMYTCDLRRFPLPTWSVLTLQPDNDTVRALDGSVDAQGLFQSQRLSSMGVVFDDKGRRIVTLLGRPMLDPTPIHVFSIGSSLGVVNLQNDLLNSLAFDVEMAPST